MSIFMPSFFLTNMDKLPMEMCSDQAEHAGTAFYSSTVLAMIVGLALL
eukprot:CAMPEP_0119561886 /NCGR_PEP_ID=MMETSP1352-20130426/18943_1 /TAXON_ID=265584 /ORGANISM="Stauroneis constricta, Strain CCMP1120" /LENGTH=47 /DNA_ID= /DNA_START= /DNA_END= /DNA_ORIENTATION=